MAHFISLRLIVLLLLPVIALVSCGVDSNPPAPPDTVTVINEFYVVGTIETMEPVEQVVAVDSTITNNHGVFDFNWNVSSSDPYSVKTYLSDNSSFTVDDLLVYQNSCGSVDSNCNVEGNAVCVFTDSNGINTDGFVAPYFVRCSEGLPGADNEADISALILGFPQTLYLISVFCNGDESSCQQSINQLEFREQYP